MGITRLARSTWLTVPMAAATIALAAPTTANAAVTARAAVTAKAAATVAAADVARDDRLVSAVATTEVGLGSYTHDGRGSGRDRSTRR